VSGHHQTTAAAEPEPHLPPPSLSPAIIGLGVTVLSFGILFFPRFSIFAVFALMAAVLIVRPWGLLGRPLK